jgi:hypothetical protein
LLRLSEVEGAIGFDQPGLRASRHDGGIVIEGTFVVTDGSPGCDPQGPLASYAVRIELSSAYPRIEPRVFETGGRITRDPDHHINGDGDCCVTVWENWLATASDTGIAAYLSGPLREYFLGQFWFEKTGSWPFGERAHGLEGMEEAYADALGIANRRKDILYHLRILRLPRPKGHWPCPCGSAQPLRACHEADLWALHRRIPPYLARAMLARLQPRKGELCKGGF